MKKYLILALVFLLPVAGSAANDLFDDYRNLLKQLQSGCKKVDELINKKNQIDARLKSERRSARDARRDRNNDDDDDETGVILMPAVLEVKVDD